MIALLLERGYLWPALPRFARGLADFTLRMQGSGAASSHRVDADTIDMTALVQEHSEAAYRVALSIVRDPDLAEDITQDALIKAWQALPTFRGDSPLRNWVLRITHNTAISTIRKRREEIRDPDMLPEEVSTSSVERQVAENVAMERFHEALDELDEVSRSIVVLRELESMSYEEICEVLDLPLPTVKTRLLRSRRTLARALEEWRP